MQTQLIIILSVTVALTFVVALVSIGLVIHKAVNAQEIRRRQRLYTHYSEKFAEVLLVDLPPLPSNARTSAIFKQYENLLVPIKKELESLPPVEARLHREMLRGVLVDFARDLSGDAIDRLIYCFYSLDFVSEQIELLKHKHWWVRAQAARDLGLLRTRRALAALTAALEDPHQDVRDQARQAIVSLAGVESLRTILRLTRRMSMWTALELSISVQQYGEETVPYLVEGLDLPDQSVVLFCIEMLAVIGFVSAVDPLRRLAKTYPSITVRAKAIEAMGRLGDQRSEDLLVSFIRDPNPALRLKALEALGRIGAPAALPALMPRLEHGTLQEQIAAARAIAATGPAGMDELHRVVAAGTKRQRAVCLHVIEERG